MRVKTRYINSTRGTSSSFEDDSRETLPVISVMDTLLFCGMRRCLVLFVVIWLLCIACVQSVGPVLMPLITNQPINQPTHRAIMCTISWPSVAATHHQPANQPTDPPSNHVYNQLAQCCCHTSPTSQSTNRPTEQSVMQSCSDLHSIYSV